MNNFVNIVRKFHVHPLFWLIIGIAVFTAHFVHVMIMLFIITIHELGHALAASFFSWRIKKISLLPFGGVVEMDEHGNRPMKEEAIVTIAGPIQHVWLIALALGIYPLDLLPASFIQLFIEYNMMILLFNLLPIWPLDGGKFVYLICSLTSPFPKAIKQTLIISSGGVVLLMGTMLFFAPYHLNSWIIISFLIFSIYMEWKQSRYAFVRFLLERYDGKNYAFKKLKPIVVEEEDYIMDVLEQFQRGYKHPIIIEKDGKKKASIDENELLHAFFTEKRTTAKVGDLLYLF